MDQVVIDYDPQWPRTFEALSATIWPAVRDIALRIEHVGSTSVPGLAAKPIIDMDVVVARVCDVAAAVAAIESLGYENLGGLGIPERVALLEPQGMPQHHLYVVWEGNAAHRNHTYFRDYLRRHPDDCERYAARKREVQHLYLTSREDYTVAKGDIVTDILDKAYAER